MLDGDGTMPLELVKAEPEGVESDGSRGVHTGRADEEGEGEFKVVAVHHRLQ